MRSVPAGRSLRVVDEIEACGGEANAITARDHVMLHARVPTADAAAALDVLVAAATTGEFDADLIEAERRGAGADLGLAAADPTGSVHEHYFQPPSASPPIDPPAPATV